VTIITEIKQHKSVQQHCLVWISLHT